MEKDDMTVGEAQEETAEKVKLPELYTGMRVEILTMENQVIFLGTLEVLDESHIKITEANNELVPKAEFNSRVKIRGYHRESGSLTIFGKICGSTDKFWKVDELQTTQTSEKRKFYRQNLSLEATVICMNRIFEPSRESTVKDSFPHPCYLRDISAGGALFRSKLEFQEGDWVLLNAQSPIPKGKPRAVTARVRRVSPGERYYECGCQFEGITEKEEDHLLQIVLFLQQKERKRRRGPDF